MVGYEIFKKTDIGYVICLYPSTFEDEDKMLMGNLLSCFDKLERHSGFVFTGYSYIDHSLLIQLLHDRGGVYRKGTAAKLKAEGSGAKYGIDFDLETINMVNELPDTEDEDTPPVDDGSIKFNFDVFPSEDGAEYFTVAFFVTEDDEDELEERFKIFSDDIREDCIGVADVVKHLNMWNEMENVFSGDRKGRTDQDIVSEILKMKPHWKHNPVIKESFGYQQKHSRETNRR